jgi:membrane protease YdiL (CAAX protease family)
MDDRLAGWLLAAALGGAMIGLAPGARRPYAVAAAALLLLYAVVLAGAVALLPATAAGWAPLIAAGAVWLAVQPLLALGRLTHAEVGLVPPRPGSTRLALVVTLVALAANAAVILLRGPGSVAPVASLLAAVLFAAVAEELVMRGAVLALADRATPPRWQLAGAPLGAAGLTVTLIFVLLHGVRPGLLLGVLPAALLYLWLRAHTGSLAAPIVAHVAWNLTVVLLHS